MPEKTVTNAPLFVKVVFVFSLFFLLFIAGLGYKHITNVSKSQQLIVHTYEVNIQLKQLFSYLKSAEVGERSFLLSNDSTYLELFFKNKKKTYNTFIKIDSLVKNSNQQAKNFTDVKNFVDDRFRSVIKVNTSKFDNQISSSEFKHSFLESNSYMMSLETKLRLMVNLQNQLLKKRLKKYESNTRFTPILLFGLMMFTMLLLFLAYLKINDDFDKVKKINQKLQIFKESTNQSEIINKHGSWRWNAEINKFHFSDNLFRLLGEEPKAFEQTIDNFMNFVHPDDIEKLSEQTEKMRKEKDLPFIFYRVIHKNGNIRHLKAYGKSIVNSEGKTQLLGTTTDITDEIDHFNTLEKRNKELELNNKELHAFNYVASHDLQEPLRKIQTFLTRLEDSESENFSEKGKKYIERINVSATRMRLLIDDLLQYSRTNKSDEIKKISDINTILEEAIQDLSDDVLKKDAKISVSNFPEMKVIPFQIKQLFINFLSNSIKYSSISEKPKIEISYKKVQKENLDELEKGFHETYHQILFKDNGIGFEQDYSDKIFELFHRLHTKDEYTGTGIGLSICKKIIDNHNGFIYATGKPNEGASFKIYIPVS